jgi:Uma2 family endonuclease
MVAVLSTEAIPQLRLSVDEYLGAQLPEGYRYELVNGVVEMTPTPALWHERVIDLILQQIGPYRLAHPDRIALVSCNATVPIPDRKTVREPDIAVYAELPPSQGEFQVWKAITPQLVVEVVSPGQEERDYEEKREEYLRAGVHEYWIVDPEARRFTALRREGDGWQQVVLPPPETYETPLLPGLLLNVRRVLLLDE